MKHIFDFLKETFGGSGESVKDLLHYLEEDQDIGKHFAGCMAIDILYGLVTKDQYEQLIVLFKGTGKEYCMADFSNFLNTASVFSPNPIEETGHEYARVISRSAFNDYYGSNMTSKFRDVDEYDDELPIDREQVLKNGWNGNKDIVWITPYGEFYEILNSFEKSTEKANNICDYLGFHRGILGGSPKEDAHVCYVYIKYPSDFPEARYQPNATNANWGVEHPLFISYWSNDRHGLTYNGSSDRPAKELIHKKSYYWHDDFKAAVIGSPEPGIMSRNNILHEIEKRFRDGANTK